MILSLPRLAHIFGTHTLVIEQHCHMKYIKRGSLNIGFQRGDGAFGSMIVRVPSKQNPHVNLYDVDEHTFVILDWAHVSGVDMFLDHHHADGDNKPPNILVNGFGRYRSIEGGSNDTKIDTPLATFVVKQVTAPSIFIRKYT